MASDGLGRANGAAMHVLVIGGGFSGLSTAIALRDNGHEVTVAEKTPGIEPPAAGITLAPNAVHALAALGVRVEDWGYPLTGLEIRNTADETLVSLLSEKVARTYGPTFGATRAALRDALMHELTQGENAGLVTIKTEIEAAIVEHVAQGIVVDLQGEEKVFELVVAADGINSAARYRLTNTSPLVYSGQTCWRGITELQAGSVGMEAWGGTSRVGIVPIDTQRAYYYLVATADQGVPDPPWPDGLREMFSEFTGLAGTLMDGLTEPPQTHHDLFEMEEPVWGRGRVLIVGDAAHALSTNQGHGAALAIEDGLAVAQALEAGPVGALERYTATRQERVRRVRAVSRGADGAAHWRTPGVRPVRNAFLRMAPSWVIDHQLAALSAPGVDLARAWTAGRTGTL